jgi:hypothetical protein
MDFPGSVEAATQAVLAVLAAADAGLVFRPVTVGLDAYQAGGAGRK